MTRRALAWGCLAAALAVSCAPSDERPGTWIRGEIATAPLDEWSFTADVPEIHVETRVVDGEVEVRFARFRAQVRERVEIG